MKLYIDPGTGSMLFAILIGIIGALRYMVKIGIVKLKFLLNGGRTAEGTSEKLPYVIFSDSKRYWNVFEPICREFNARGIDVVYMTASADDPALECGYEHIKAEFVGEGNKAFARLNFLEASVLLSTTPGLEVYQWKRSKKVDYYVHIPHNTGDILLYRMFGIDYYDAILITGSVEEQDIRRLEKLRCLKEKDVFTVGIPYLDEMAKRLEDSGEEAEHERTVLLAPSWGESAILSRFGGEMIEKLTDTGYHIIIRPHPQSFDSEKELMEKLMKQYPDSSRLEWNRDRDNFAVLKRSDILISDFSGVVFDFALVYDKPVIYADTKFDKSPYDAWWLEGDCWTMKALPRIGVKLSEENFGSMKAVIDACIEDSSFSEKREEVRNEAWQYRGESARRTVDYLTAKYTQLTMPEDNKE